MPDTQLLKQDLDNAIDEFNSLMNLKNIEYSNLGYNEDAIIMMDELAKQTSELANKFKEAVINYLG